MNSVQIWDQPTQNFLLADSRGFHACITPPHKLLDPYLLTAPCF
jgi:hypothetical protein